MKVSRCIRFGCGLCPTGALYNWPAVSLFSATFIQLACIFSTSVAKRSLSKCVETGSFFYNHSIPHADSCHMKIAPIKAFSMYIFIKVDQIMPKKLYL